MFKILAKWEGAWFVEDDMRFGGKIDVSQRTQECPTSLVNAIVLIQVPCRVRARPVFTRPSEAEDDSISGKRSTSVHRAEKGQQAQRHSAADAGRFGIDVRH